MAASIRKKKPRENYSGDEVSDISWMIRLMVPSQQTKAPAR